MHYVILLELVSRQSEFAFLCVGYGWRIFIFRRLQNETKTLCFVNRTLLCVQFSGIECLFISER